MKSETDLSLSSLQISSPPQEDETEGGVNVGQLIQTLQRKWWLIAAVTLGVTAAASAKVLTNTATYVGSLEILVKPLTAETEVISNIPETLSSPESAPGLDQDLLKILTSPRVLKPVVEKVQERYPAACSNTATANPVETSAAPASAEPDSAEPDSIAPASTEQTEAALETCYKKISQSLTVGGFSKNSNILLITFQDPDPQKVSAVLEAISESYLDYSLESTQADISLGIEFVEKKLPDLRAKVDSLQSQLQTLRLDNNLIDPSALGGQLSGQVGKFSQQRIEVAAQLKELRNVYDDLESQIQQPGETNASSALNDNPRYQSLLNSLLELDAKIAADSTLYLDNAPDMEVLTEQRQNLLKLLSQQGQQSLQETTSRIRELESREQALNEAIQGLNSDVDNLSGISRRYTDIQRELTVATDNLSQFLAKREALEIDAAQREIPWEIITPPTEPVPERPSLPQNLALGGLLGLLLGVGAALLLDKSGGVIHSDEEIRRTTRLPVLGRIPQQNFSEMVSEKAKMAESLQYVGANIRGDRGGHRKGGVFSSNNGKGPKNPYENDPFSESFRSLYTNLRLTNSGNPVRSVAVSSAMPGEGKSTVALHLAEAAAAMGQRVLLVDADLRNPQLHKYLELSNEKGLTNLFSGESNPALIQKFSPESNMHIIAAGSAPFEPSRLFASRSMKLFTEKVKTAFDLVIFDTPPLLGQSDAYLIADHTDGMLLVTQPGRIKQSLLDQAMEQIKIADINVLGIVTRDN